MAVLPILIYPDPVLTYIAGPIALDDTVRDLAQDMIDTMLDSPIGVGLSAPQVGVLARLIVVGRRDPRVMLNPNIIATSGGFSYDPESCLSQPGRKVRVKRAKKIVCSWVDLDGSKQTQHFKGDQARCIQHEVDHLNGINIGVRA